MILSFFPIGTTFCNDTIRDGPLWTTTETTEPYDAIETSPSYVASVRFTDRIEIDAVYARKRLDLARAENAAGIAKTRLVYESETGGLGFAVTFETPTRGMVDAVSRYSSQHQPARHLSVGRIQILKSFF